MSLPAPETTRRRLPVRWRPPGSARAFGRWAVHQPRAGTLFTFMAVLTAFDRLPTCRAARTPSSTCANPGFRPGRVRGSATGHPRRSGSSFPH